MLYLQTNPAEAKRLAIMNQGFIIMWMATIHSEILVCVVGLTCRSVPIKPSLRQTLVSRKVTYAAHQNAVNLMVGGVMVKVLDEDS